jgi:hypothetical protein
VWSQVRHPECSEELMSNVVYGPQAASLSD